MSDNTILYYTPKGEDNFTIKDYNEAISKKDRKVLATFIYNRLYSRYIKPFEFNNEDYKKEYKNGFSMMASFCLLIETLQSFKEGLGDSNRKSGKLFKVFFEEQKDYFNGIDGEDFYKNIRCGILHQGETTGGWKLNRKTDTKIIDGNNINVNKFMEKLKFILVNYCEKLEKSEWEKENWLYFKFKMNYTIKNCE